MNNHPRTALVTGATSGLGLEVGAQLGAQDHGPVIITGRTEAKVAEARRTLASRSGSDPFETLVLDNDDLASVEAAAAKLIERGNQVDLLILNAGIAPGSKVSIGPDGIERTISSTVTGHHVLTMRLLEHGLLGPDADIVIATSEAARGDVPMFHPIDFRALADESFEGDLEAAIEAQMRIKMPATFKPGDQYATAKVLVAWWAAELARKMPDGMSVNAVSPGSTPNTNAIRNAPFLMRYVLLPMFKFMPGMSHGVSDGAGRYLEIAERGPEVNGQAFASPPKKMVGPLVRMEQPHIISEANQRAGWDAIVRTSGVDFPEMARATELAAAA
jgi:NAD(P)-dependent dehydrogenase (short-subunit alcohol dehydrogenase family)